MDCSSEAFIPQGLRLCVCVRARECVVCVCFKRRLKSNVRGAEEVAHRWKALAALPGDPGLVPSIHITAHNCLSLRFQGTQCHLLTAVSTRQAKSAHIENTFF